jgi:hypothetical protein
MGLWEDFPIGKSPPIINVDLAMFEYWPPSVVRFCFSSMRLIDGASRTSDALSVVASKPNRTIAPESKGSDRRTF